MTGVEVVIITYNSGAEIGPCLDAVAAAGLPALVIDNASTDSTVREATRRGARIVINKCNLGFAAAVNQGFAATSAPLILLLNPDTHIEAGVEVLANASLLPSAAGAGGLLLGDDGLPQLGFMVRRFPTAASLALEALVLNRVWPSNPVNRRYRALDLDYSVQFEADQPAGAFLMIRRDVFDKLGGFDEKYYPVWFEDVDFCRRAVDAGYRWFFVPGAVARHTGGHSVRKIEFGIRPFYWYRSLLRYTLAHFPPTRARMVCLAVIGGSIPRMLAESIFSCSFKPVKVYCNVMRLAFRCFWSPSANLD